MIVLYGGTFDPVHLGHLAVAKAARDALEAEVRLLPAADPPHRAPPGASAEQRARMLELAVAGEPGLIVDRREVERSGASYTVDTLAALREQVGNDVCVAWLLGADAFRGLPAWHRWQELFGLAHWVVAVRPGHDLDELPTELATACAGRWTQSPDSLKRLPWGGLFRLELPHRPESSTELRSRAAFAGHWDALVPPAVAEYIRGHRLYGVAG